MAKFVSKDGSTTRITGVQKEGQRKHGSYVEVQLFGGEVMLTANQEGDGETSNVQMTNAEARMFAAAILDAADASDARGQQSVQKRVQEVFSSNLAAFDEVDRAHTAWLKA